MKTEKKNMPFFEKREGKKVWGEEEAGKENLRIGFNKISTFVQCSRPLRRINLLLLLLLLLFYNNNKSISK